MTFYCKDEEGNRYKRTLDGEEQAAQWASYMIETCQLADEYCALLEIDGIDITYPKWEDLEWKQTKIADKKAKDELAF